MKPYIVVRMKDPGDIYAFVVMAPDVDTIVEDYNLAGESYHVQGIVAESANTDADGKIHLVIDPEVAFPAEIVTSLPYMYI